MKGKEFKFIVEQLPDNKDVVAGKMGISPRHLYNLFKLEEVNASELKKYTQAGYKLENHLKADSYKQELTHVKALLKKSEAHNLSLISHVNVLQRIIDKGIEKDHIFFNAVAAKLRQKKPKKKDE